MFFFIYLQLFCVSLVHIKIWFCNSCPKQIGINFFHITQLCNHSELVFNTTHISCLCVTSPVFLCIFMIRSPKGRHHFKKNAFTEGENGQILYGAKGLSDMALLLFVWFIFDFKTSQMSLRLSRDFRCFHNIVEVKKKS